MAVNLSVKQLQHSDIAADVADALSESGLPAACLTLEITETVMMTDTDTALRRLNELKELGVRLAMDDFGTGYSSLSYLSQLPVDILKMDRSFLRAGASPQASALASVVVGLGESLHLDVVAEGIEYGDQWTALRDLGCDLGQGFLFARPMDAHSTLEYLRTVIPSPAADASKRSLGRRGRAHLFSPLRERDFRLLWGGMCVSLTGDGVFLIAMAWQVYALSNAPTALAMVGVAMTVPTLVSCSSAGSSATASIDGG